MTSRNIHTSLYSVRQSLEHGISIDRSLSVGQSLQPNHSATSATISKDILNMNPIASTHRSPEICAIGVSFPEERLQVRLRHDVTCLPLCQNVSDKAGWL